MKGILNRQSSKKRKSPDLMKCLRILLLLNLAIYFLPPEIYAQKGLLPLSPYLKAKPASFFTDSVHQKNFLLQVQNGQLQQKLPDAFIVLSKYDGILLVRTTPASFLQLLHLVKGLIYADENVTPTVDGGVINYDMSVNRVNTSWQRFPSINGSGYVVSVKEDKMDTTDLDLLGKNIFSSIASPRGSTHATIMTTLISGSGNSYFTGKGVAPQSQYSSSDFSNVLPDTAAYYRQPEILIQNHSYGVGIQNYYGINARAFDLSQNQDIFLQHVFSAGNSGTSTSTTGPYAGIPNFANITGNMKMAKNVLVVGAVDSAGKLAPLSSRGPAYDGRIKPELMAYGDDGSSGAAAIASGTCILLEQAFSQYGHTKSPSWLLRAVLINSAGDIGLPGPDFETGFGLINALAAIETVRDNRYFTGNALQGTDNIFFIDVPSSARNLKLTLSWNDTAVQAGAGKALLNDIDLELVDENNTIWRPWVLNIFPSVDSLGKSATRSVDTLNNNEQVSLENPLPGRYTVRIKGKLISNGTLPFAVAYHWDTAGTFQWNFPMQNDPVPGGSIKFARWSSTYPAGTRGELQWSFNSGPGWTTISDTVLMENQQFEVRFPDTLAMARLRMITGADVILSDQFLITPSMNIKFGFACDSSVLTHWEKVPAATQYHLYQLSGNQMAGKLVTSDTTALITGTGSPYFAVAPLISGIEAFRGPTLNYLRQGIGCYINNFLADLVDLTNARIQLTLGSLYKVKGVRIVKISRNSEVLFSTNQPSLVTYTVTDTKLEHGLNQYQAMVILEDGRTILSSVETVYYLNNLAHIIFPNPVRQGGHFYLLSDFPVDGNAVIYDAWGRKIMEFVIQEKQQAINVNRLSRGIYFIMIFRQGKLISRLPFVVQ
jgi:hypothetical protein